MTNPPNDTPPPQSGAPDGQPVPPADPPPAAPQYAPPPQQPAPQQPVPQPTYAPPGGQAPPPAYPPAAAPGAPLPPRGGSGAKGLAITALILGIAALVFSWVPVLGLILGIVGVVLGIMALSKKQPKGLGLTGLILAAVGTVISLIVTIIAAVALFTIGAAFDELENSTTQVETPAPVEEPAEPTEPAEPEEPSGEFSTLTAAEFDELIADPDAWAGSMITIYGTVVQFDEGTGDCSFRLYTAHEQLSNPDEYWANTIAYAGDGVSDCPGFEVFAVGDNLVLEAEVVGEEIYFNTEDEEISALWIDVWGAETY